MAHCKWCGKELPTGYEAVEMDTYAKGFYCNKSCARSAVEEELDEIVKDFSCPVTIEDADPYASVGVSRGDFI